MCLGRVGLSDGISLIAIRMPTLSERPIAALKGALSHRRRESQDCVSVAQITVIQNASVSSSRSQPSAEEFSRICARRYLAASAPPSYGKR